MASRNALRRCQLSSPMPTALQTRVAQSAAECLSPLPVCGPPQSSTRRLAWHNRSTHDASRTPHASREATPRPCSCQRRFLSQRQAVPCTPCRQKRQSYETDHCPSVRNAIRAAFNSTNASPEPRVAAWLSRQYFSGPSGSIRATSSIAQGWRSSAASRTSGTLRSSSFGHPFPCR